MRIPLLILLGIALLSALAGCQSEAAINPQSDGHPDYPTPELATTEERLERWGGENPKVKSKVQED